MKDYDKKKEPSYLQYEGYFLKVDVQYTEKLHELHYGLPFLL